VAINTDFIVQCMKVKVFNILDKECVKWANLFAMIERCYRAGWCGARNGLIHLGNPRNGLIFLLNFVDRSAIEQKI
jgi:hypothetical protein